MSTRPNPPGFGDRLKEARKRATDRTQMTDEGPEWPKWDQVELDAALEELTLAVYDFGLKVGLGIMSDGQGVWCRLTFPVDANHFNQGCVAFTVSDTAEKALRKAVQLIEVKSPKVWKIDQFQRDKPRERL